jgi:ABC-type multidrug transport system ATPase subunit
VVATHDLETIDGVADRAVLLHGGRLTSIDGAGTLRERYRRATRDA